MVMGFAAKLIEAGADTDLAAALTETQAVVEEMQEDLAQLKPNVMLDTVKSWVPGLMAFGYRLLIAALILFVGFRVVKLLRRVLNTTFGRMGLDSSVSKLLNNVFDTVMYAILIFIAAEKIGIPSASIIALLGSAGIAIGLSLQGSLSNVAGGLLILLTRPFGIGDYISGAGVEGAVQNIGLVYTTLLTGDNRKITIPNASISNSTIINASAKPKRRVDVEVGISYSSDIRKAKGILEEIFRNHEKVLVGDGITVFVGKLADSAVMIGARGWVMSEDYWDVLWSIQEQVKLAFDEGGIEIPFNQMDINIRSMPGR